MTISINPTEITALGGLPLYFLTASEVVNRILRQITIHNKRKVYMRTTGKQR